MSELFNFNDMNNEMQDLYSPVDEYTVLYMANGYGIVPVDITDVVKQVKFLPLVLRKRLLYSQIFCL